MLRALLDHLRTHLTVTRPIPEAKVEVAAAVLSWYRAMIVEAEAIALLGTTEHAEATVSNLRSLCEAWLQLRYTIMCTPDPVVAARTARAFALLEFGEFLTARGATPDDIAPVKQELAALRKYHSQLITDLEKGRAAKGRARLKYWSGKGPAGMISVVQKTIDPATRLADYYKLASWDAHHIMTPALNASLDLSPPSPCLRLKAKLSPTDDAAFSEGVAIYFLVDGWTLLRGLFDWPPLDPPTAPGTGGEVL